MNEQQNHIGTIFRFVQNIATELSAQYTHGNITEFDINAFTVFPLVHLTIVDIRPNLQTGNCSIRFVVADRVSYLKTENSGLNEESLYSLYGYTENNNYAFVLQDLYIRVTMALRKYEMQNYSNLQLTWPVTFTPFIETLNSVVAGYEVSLDIQITTPLVTDGRC